jgi:hypothetical protein
MAFDLSVTELWLQATIEADATVAGLIAAEVFLIEAPQGTPMPYIVIAFQAGDDVNTFGSRGLAQPLFLAKAVGKREQLPILRQLADRIDNLLQDTKVVTSGFQIRIQRETPVRYPEFNTSGIEYTHIGGMYRCWVSPAV